MQAFVAGGFRNAELKFLNFFRKFPQAVPLADIATADKKRISFQAYRGVKSNGLHKDIMWPKVPTKEEMPPAFVTLWKSALNKCFVNQFSSINQRISTNLEQGDWVDQDIEGKWVRWSIPGEFRIYQRNNNNWSYYRQRYCRYYLDDEAVSCPLNLALSISVVPVATRFRIEGLTTVFVLLPTVNTLSNFEDKSARSTLSEGFNNTINDKTILLNKLFLLEDMCNNLVEGIRNGTTGIVSDGSFDAASPIVLLGRRLSI